MLQVSNVARQHWTGRLVVFHRFPSFWGTKNNYMGALLVWVWQSIGIKHLMLQPATVVPLRLKSSTIPKKSRSPYLDIKLEKHMVHFLLYPHWNSDLWIRTVPHSSYDRPNISINIYLHLHILYWSTFQILWPDIRFSSPSRDEAYSIKISQDAQVRTRNSFV